MKSQDLLLLGFRKELTIANPEKYRIRKTISMYPRKEN